MNNNICSAESRAVLKEYAENISIARALAEGQNIRPDFLNLLSVMENMRQKWNAERLRADTLQQQVNTKESDYSGMLLENRITKEQLRDARAQIASLMFDKQNLERDIAEMERKFALVSDLLKVCIDIFCSEVNVRNRPHLVCCSEFVKLAVQNDRSLLNEEDRQKLAFLNDKPLVFEPNASQRWTSNVGRAVSRAVSHGEDIDYDRTADSMEVSYDDSDESHLRNGKVYRRSHSLAAVTGARPAVATVKRPKESMRMSMFEEDVGTPSKRSKDGTETIITTTTTITVDSGGRKPSTAHISIRRSMNRSMSESNILKQEEEAAADSVSNALVSRCGASALDLRSPPNAVETWTNGASIETRPHTYANFTSILGDRCEVCNRWIGFRSKPAFKCADCGIRLHKSCVNDAPTPCVPRTPTPRTPGKQRPRLKDFCPSSQPMIPPLIIHCVLTLDRDRLSTTGIYRIPGHESQVVKLLNEFKSGRCMPKLEYHDTETITGCIKRFLMKEIRDSIIPVSSWEEFLSAAKADDVEALKRSVMELPYPNRDTLAFLCAHFQKICDKSAQNSMTPEVLARCIAPTVVGHTSPPTMTLAQKTAEAAKQSMVMLALLRLSRDFWPRFYSFDNGRPLLKSPMRTCNHFLGSSNYNQEGRTPVRPSYQTAINTRRKDPNQSMLGPVDSPPADPSILQPSSSRRGRYFADFQKL